MKARARIPTCLYKSDNERVFSIFGKALLEQYFGIKCTCFSYEPETFNIPGGKYTPDFRLIMDDGSVIFVEVKGSVHQHNYRDARTKLRAAATLNQCYTFVEVQIAVRENTIQNCKIEVIR